jgi:transposase
MKTKKVDRLQDLIDLVEKLREEIADLKRQLAEKDLIIAEKDRRIKDLEDRLNKNSQNSSKPPSTDFFRKPKSERTSSGKKAGGQQGHEGSTLKQVANPDLVEKHDIDQCDSCQSDLSNVQAVYAKRQEVDIPTIKPITTEHQIASKKCPNCKTVSVAKAPAHLTQKIQYGPQVKAITSYFNNDQLIPVQRTKNVLNDIFSIPVSEGTIVNINTELFEKLADHEAKSREKILQSPVIHLDETGVDINGELHWLHVASTSTQTLYYVHPSRGTKAIDAINILPQYTGAAIHDHLKAYFQYTKATHSLCNAHHIRELRGMHENYQQQWALEMINFLIALNTEIHNLKAVGHTIVSKKRMATVSDKYDEILKNGLPQIPAIKLSSGVRGRKKQHPAKNLWDRLIKFKSETLLFASNFQVPFTNNQAEQDIRMTKVKQKISGGFRSVDGANNFCRIRGFISTSKKQKVNVLHAIGSIFRSQLHVGLSP